MKDKINRYEVKYDLLVMNVVGIIYTILLIVLICLMFKNNLFVSNFGEFPVLFDNEHGLNYWWFLFFILYLCWMAFHEIIHCVTYVLFGAKWKNISFGAALEKSILYCKCGEDVSKKILWPF